MSMNIYFEAEREIIVVKTGNHEIQSLMISVWQTPTNVTREILSKDDHFKAYCDWIESISEDSEEDVYAEDDIFEERDPIGKKIVNYGKLHIIELKQKFESLEKQGYTITAVEM